MGRSARRRDGRTAYGGGRGGGGRPPPRRPGRPPPRTERQPVRRAEGYHRRFGLVHVDFETRKRTPRASYGWYRDLIAAHRA
ncbi:family 1 glycosylhydrolase [Kitasatospora purpeofusca]|nr:family 1 glycosylhydrolase [Kitasatospora purpeofusca]